MSLKIFMLIENKLHHQVPIKYLLDYVEDTEITDNYMKLKL